MGQGGHMEVLSVSQMKTSLISCLRGRFHLESQLVLVDHHSPTVSSDKTTSVQHMQVLLIMWWSHWQATSIILPSAITRDDQNTFLLHHNCVSTIN